MDDLSSDLIPFISEAGATVLMVKIVDTRTLAREGDSERGTVNFEVLRVFQGDPLRAGTSIEVFFSRKQNPVLRVRNLLNYWNVLALKPGEVLLLVCQPSPAVSHAWTAFAAMQVESSADPKIKELEECYHIERFNGSPEDKEDLVEQSLEGNGGLLRDYALDLVSRRSIFGRALGAEIVTKAISSAHTPPDQEFALASRLLDRSFFETTSGPDATNVRIVAALASGFITETRQENRLEWAALLGSAVLREFSSDPARDRTIRRDLIRAIKSPASNQVISVLTDPGLDGAKDSREILLELLEVWRASAPSQR